MSQRKMSAMKQRSALGQRDSTVNWAVVLGFATALFLAGVAYYSFKDELILKRSIASTPVDVPLAPVVRRTK